MPCVTSCCVYCCCELTKSVARKLCPGVHRTIAVPAYWDCLHEKWTAHPLRSTGPTLDQFKTYLAPFTVCSASCTPCPAARLTNTTCTWPPWWCINGLAKPMLHLLYCWPCLEVGTGSGVTAPREGGGREGAKGQGLDSLIDQDIAYLAPLIVCSASCKAVTASPMLVVMSMGGCR